MPRYCKKPVEVDAIHYDGTNRDEVAEFMGGARQAKVEQKKLPGPGRGLHDGIAIHTLEGTMNASVGDWIIRGVQGEYYPCKPDIFDAAAHLSYLNGGAQAPPAVMDRMLRTAARGVASVRTENEDQAATLTAAANAVADVLSALYPSEDQEGKRAWFLSEAGEVPS
jgi:hypothetical protein